MTRNLLRTADFLPLAYVFGLISMCISGRFQRLGDIAAGSLVIHHNTVQDLENLPECAPVAAPVMLDVEDQVARHHRAGRAPAIHRRTADGWGDCNKGL